MHLTSTPSAKGYQQLAIFLSDIEGNTEELKALNFNLKQGSFNSILFCTRVLICPQSDQEGNKLHQPNCKFCRPLKKKKFRSFSVQPFLRGSNDFRVGRKNGKFSIVFFSRGRAKDLSAPLYFCNVMFNQEEKNHFEQFVTIQFRCLLVSYIVRSVYFNIHFPQF